MRKRKRKEDPAKESTKRKRMKNPRNRRRSVRSGEITFGGVPASVPPSRHFHLHNGGESATLFVKFRSSRTVFPTLREEWGWVPHINALLPRQPRRRYKTPQPYDGSCSMVTKLSKRQPIVSNLLQVRRLSSSLL